MLMSCAAAATATIAWFKSGTDVSFGGNANDRVKVKSGVLSGYYGGGTGTSGDPYIISNKTHLYNLAWLQYLGTYNNPTVSQLYFKVTTDIDMKGLTLPPIGTDTYPFLGNFYGVANTDGDYPIISNLTVSNSFADYGLSHPTSVSSSNYVAPEIVGFFGVVGRLPTQSITYSSSVVGMSNFTLNNLTVRSETSRTLIGLAAGYVDGTMNGIKIDGNATLDVDGETTTASLGSITDKISDYGLVGYTAHTSRSGTFKQELSAYYDSDDDEGQGDDWGGSIAVEEIYNRLMTIRNSYARGNSSPVLEKTFTYREGDTLVSEETTKTGNITVYEYNENLSQSTYNNKIGAFQSGRTTGTSVDGIHSLSGGHYTKTVEQVKHQYRPITDGTNYLSVRVNDNNTPLFTNANSENTCTVWNIPVGSTGKIYTVEQYANSQQYITIVNGVLELSSTQSGTVNWTVTTTSDGKLKIVSGNYHLVFDEEWMVKDASQTNEVYYHIYTSDGHYFYPGGTETNNPYYLRATSDSSQQIKWYYDSTYRAYYYMRSGASRYLMYNENSTYLRVIANNSKNQNSNFYRLYTGNNYGTTAVSGTGKLRYSNNSNFVTWNSNNDGGWTLANQNQSSTFTVEQISIPIVINDNVLNKTIDYYGPDTTPISDYMDYSEQDVTYFPLNTKDDYTPADNNTGYVIGGSSYTANTSSYGYGNVRVSNFYQLSTSISNYSRTTHKLTNVRTYNASGSTTINDTTNTYQKYANSKEKVENILKKHETENQVYGLHFMQDSISSSKLVTAKYAQINTDVYSNYQLPASSIDFNLKARGFVNFFAGTYGNDGNGNHATVDSFFSLHQIRRNSNNKIVSIDEIEQILSDGNQDHAYIYKLSNGKYTIPYSYDIYNQKTKYVLDTTTLLSTQYPDEEFTQVSSYPSTYSVVFDTSWIKNNSDIDQLVMYYFEIPINCGEFCLGSVNGSNFGAYLVYLDIGAFARDNDKVEAYNVTTFANSVAYPDGVDFAVVNATGVGGESIGVYLPTNITGSVTFAVTSSNIAITDTSSLTTYSFKGTKYADSSATGKFTVSGNSPGALVLPAPGGERLIHITVDAVDGSLWYIDILDELNADGTIKNTTYPLIKKNGVDQQPSAIPTSVTEVLDEKIRTLARIVTFTRTSGSEEFNTTAAYDEATRKVVSATVTSDNLSDIIITVSNVTTGYTISINGTPVSNGSTYHP